MEAPPPRRVTPKTASTSEGSRTPPASAAPRAGDRLGERAGQAVGARPKPRRRGRGGARLPVARCASPRRGPGGRRRRGGEGRRKLDPIKRFAGSPPPGPGHSPPRLWTPLVRAPLHLATGACLPHPGHAPQAPPRPAPLRYTAVPTIPPPLARGDVRSPPQGSAPVFARTLDGALRRGMSCKS